MVEGLIFMDYDQGFRVRDLEWFRGQGAGYEI
jgi:hypothetical protein